MAFRVCILQLFRPCGHKVCFREGKDVCEVPSMVNMETYLPFGKDKSSFPMLDLMLARPKKGIGKIFQNRQNIRGYSQKTRRSGG